MVWALLGGIVVLKTDLRFIVATGIFTLASGAASAQQAGSSELVDDWSGELALSISPRVGQPLSAESDDSPIDESEGGVSVAVKRKGDRGFTHFQVKVGADSSPQLLDDADATSAVYGELTLGDAFIPFPLLAEELGGADASDAVRPYARYRYARKFADFLGDYDRTDHKVTAGVRYRDIRKLMSSSMVRDASGRLSPVMGWYWEGRAEISRVWSTNDAKELLNPLVRVDVYSRPMLLGRLFARAQGDVGFYEHAQTPTGEKRVDKTMRLTGGLSLDSLISRLSGALSAEAAVQYQRRWSNEPTARHERWYFVPSVTVTTKF